MSEIKLPGGWKLERLGNIIDCLSGFAFKSSEYKSKGIPLVRISNIIEGKVLTDIDETVYIDEKYFDLYKDFTLKQNDILIAMSGATTGKFGLFSNNDIAFLNQRVGLLRKKTKSKVQSKYLYYYLFVIKNDILKKAYGAAQPNISIKELKDFIIPLSNENIQNQIVEKLEELFSELDAGIENLKKVKNQLKLYRQSVLKYAFEGRLTNPNLKPGELPEGWKRVKLGKIIEPSKDKYDPLNNKTLKFVGLEHIEKDTGKISCFISSDEVRSTKNIFNKGDLLYGKLRPYLNKVAVADFDGICSTDILVFKKTKVLSNTFIKYRFLQRDFVNYAQKNVNGVHHPRVNFKTLSEFEISLPDYSEQVQIVSEIDLRLSECDAMESGTEKALQQAESLRQSILKAAFEGKLTTAKIELIKKLTPFEIMIVIANLIKGLLPRTQGEMAIVKDIYILDRLFKFKTGLKFTKGNYGPYNYSIKKALYSPNKYFERSGKPGFETFVLSDKSDKLFGYSYKFIEPLNKAINDLKEIVNLFPDKPSYYTELLATVCMIIEEKQSIDIQVIRNEMEKWETPKTKFANKAVKFNLIDTKKILDLIIEKGWDKILK